MASIVRRCFQALRAESIGVNVHYAPVHLHPFYRERFGTGPGLCPIAEAASQQILTPAHLPHDERRRRAVRHRRRFAGLRSGADRISGPWVLKIVAIIQARLGSTRLPGKVLLDLAGEPMLARVVNRVRRARRVDEVRDRHDHRDARRRAGGTLARTGWPCFRGSEERRARPLLSGGPGPQRGRGGPHHVRLSA